MSKATSSAGRTPSARDAIIAAVRRALRRDGALDASIAAALDARLAAHATHLKPAVDDDLVDRLVRKLEAVHVSVSRVDNAADVVQAVGEHLAAHGLPQRMVVADDPALDEVDWPRHWAVERRSARRDDRVAVTGVFAAVAEAGTLALVSSGDTPTSLNFLPDDHIAVVGRGQIVRHLEDLWARLRERLPGLPRAVNLVTGPSKTADVEQTMQYGAHGPRRLHVILLEER